VLLVVAITASGGAYLTLSNELAWIAYISGPVLLLWVAGIGIWLTVHSRRQARALQGSGHAMSGGDW
jgi:hypothetical protein